MRIVILANDDITSNLIFAPLILRNSENITAIVYSKSPAKGRSSLFTAAIALLRKMDVRYWLYLTCINIAFQVFVRICFLISISKHSGPLVSLRAIAAERQVPITWCGDFNGEEFRRYLSSLKVDLLIVRIGTVLRRSVLQIPRRGTWCVHSSLLPAFGGIAGEFHALRTPKAPIGSTVFVVEEKLDAGEPIAQVVIERDDKRSVFWHTIGNNRAAGALLTRMVTTLASGEFPRGPLHNAGLEPSYFSWPSKAQVKQFRDRGGRLIAIREAARLFRAALHLDRGKW